MRKKIKIDVGTRFSSLVVIGEAPKTKEGRRTWFCACDCGNQTNTDQRRLFSGKTKSCGCVSRARTHGLSGPNRPYWVWKAMRARCNNPKDKGYGDYGGRGIRVCSRWDDFTKFIEDMGPRKPGDTLDRIDNNGNYCPENCRWASRTQQNRNTRRNRFFIIGNKKKALGDLCEEFGVPYKTVRNRVLRGWPIGPALQAPVLPQRYSKKEREELFTRYLLPHL